MNLPGADLDSDDDSGYLEFFTQSWAPVRLFVSIRATETRFVDDVVQEAFLITRAKWPVVRNYDKPEKWVIKVALRMLLRIQGKEQKRGKTTELVVPDPSTTIVEHQQLYAAIQQLTPRRAETITLFMLGYSIAESADVLRVSEGTIKRHLYLARCQLKEILGSLETDGGQM